MTLTKAQHPMDQADYWQQRDNIHTSFVLGIITRGEAIVALAMLSLSPEHAYHLLERWADERKLEDIHKRFGRRALSRVDAVYELEQLEVSLKRAGELLNDWEDYRTVASFTEAGEA